MKNIIAFLFLLIIFSCTPDKPVQDLSSKNIIPKPRVLESNGESFTVNSETTINYPKGSKELERIAQGLSVLFKAKVQENTGGELTNAISLNMNLKDAEFGREGYKIEISNNLIDINANGLAGIFYAIQTVRQLQPVIDYSENDQWIIPGGTIKDYPEYPYRGAMLDVSRHFFTPQVVKRYIDLMAMYKMNVLHLHLSDDQGWRIHINSWPNLTEHGGSTQVDGGEGGFYTQEQYAELVVYAGSRFITIVPEIDMPGHTNAALASYPELNCDGKARELYTGTDVGFSTLCTSKEITYKFIEDVISELARLTPGPFIHIGGDESHVTPMEDYIPFINRVQEIVAKNGKQIIGWDEIAHAKLLPNTIVQYWDKAENAKLGIAQGAKVLMSPAKRAYLDMKYDSTTQLGLNWAGYIEVDKAYNWKPESLEEGIGPENIVGIEAPLWTETITNMDEIENMAFPRLVGIAEIGWTPRSRIIFFTFSNSTDHPS